MSRNKKDKFFADENEPILIPLDENYVPKKEKKHLRKKKQAKKENTVIDEPIIKKIYLSEMPLVKDETDKTKNELKGTNDEILTGPTSEIKTEEIKEEKSQENHEKEKIQEEFDFEYDKDKEKRIKKITKITNIVLVVLFLLILISAIDIVNISKNDKEPFFEIKTKTYKDGGSKVYYGLGYKVIKYHQKQGRRDIVVGTWTMPYQGEPTNIELIDLAINLKEKPEETYEEIAKKFIRVSGNITNIDTQKNIITISYVDEENKYSLNIDAKLDKDAKDISKFDQGSIVYIIGTVSKYEIGNKDKVNTLTLSNCFAE